MDYQQLANIIATIAVGVWVAIQQALTAKKVNNKLEPNGGSSLADKIDDIVNKLLGLQVSVDKIEVWKRAWMELYENPIFILDNSGFCVWVNNEYLKSTGTTFQDVQGLGWMKIIHPSDRPAVKESWDISFSTQSTFEMDFRIVNIQNKNQIPVRCKIRALHRDNELAGFIGILDLTTC